jgi:drug/metabolite transporter (DMT)-like permease
MPSNTSKGIRAMIAAVAAFAVLDAAMKELSQSYPALQVSYLRGVTSLPFFMIFVAATRQWRSILPVRWSGHVIRGGLAIVMLLTFIYAVRNLPLSTAYGIFLCAPLLITALSAMFLGEHVGLHRWLAIACGLAGVVVILKPDGKEMITLAGLAAFTSALCYAVAALMIRQLTRTDSTLSIATSFLLTIAVITGIAAVPGWVPLESAHWPWILAMGAGGAAGQYLIIYAFKWAPASVVAPFEYTALLWGISLDWLLWNSVPGARMLGGAGIVIASGLYLMYRERRSQGSQASVNPGVAH